MDNNTDNKKQNIQDNDNKDIISSEATPEQDIINEHTLSNKDVSGTDNELQDKETSNKINFKQKYINKTNIILLVILIILAAGGIIYNQKNKTEDKKITAAINNSIEITNTQPFSLHPVLHFAVDSRCLDFPTTIVSSL